MTRISQTKIILSRSLKDLMARMPLQKITIQNITDNCSVNRQTFYYYFKDIFELLKWTFDHEVFDEVRKESYHDWEAGARHLIRYANANKSFCRNVVRSLNKEDVEAAFRPILHRWVEVEAARLSRLQKLSPRDLEYFVHFYTMAFVGYSIDWVRRGMAEDETEILGKVQLLLDILNPTIEPPDTRTQ